MDQVEGSREGLPHLPQDRHLPEPGGKHHPVYPGRGAMLRLMFMPELEPHPRQPWVSSSGPPHTDATGRGLVCERGANRVVPVWGHLQRDFVCGPGVCRGTVGGCPAKESAPSCQEPTCHRPPSSHKCSPPQGTPHQPVPGSQPCPAPGRSHPDIAGPRGLPPAAALLKFITTLPAPGLQARRRPGQSLAAAAAARR